ncbi:MAG TPA: exodeoxyribonuclease III [Flavobacteriales bacterium]|jgi:exodeoxyribonuclease-3|nr:exodeoxyribonuclease III [Flavobacteriales bacterium]HJN63295.1 exodeoxyribonuclease III [Flavobacteriales bacterium]|tara:strand:- start:8804 stop:9571 length:768 start_codon:yes stop_codon:yes gene_type:complete
MVKIFTYNVNGIRAALRKDFASWLKATNPDVLCLQEIKANSEQFDESIFTDLGYNCFWNSAEKKGYSGVAILTKTKPQHVEYGCGIEQIDFEGRILRADFDDFSVMSAYFPSGSSGDLRQAFKIKFLNQFQTYINTLKKDFPKLIISGDYNICHKAIDIHNPQRNKNTSGFLPEEREWMSGFITSGFVDSFRSLNPEPHNYSWWSYRANARAKNLGWRIDYNMISKNLLAHLSRSAILSQAFHSDHCPVLVELDF